MRLKLAYGRTGLGIDLPNDASVTVIEPQFVPGLPDEQAAIVEALRAPTGTRPLRELVSPGDTVAIVFSDLTRPMPNDRVLPPLLDELAGAGVPDDQVVLINALGTHRPQTDEELRQMLGDDLVARCRIVQHDAWDDASLVEVTRNHLGNPVRVNRTYVDASVRILTGFIEPHLFAGFSGGPKAVLPGIADIESILDNHGPALIANPKATWAVLDGNPLWEEMLAGARSTAPTFLLNVTLNQERQITGVFAGDLEKPIARAWPLCDSRRCSRFRCLLTWLSPPTAATRWTSTCTRRSRACRRRLRLSSRGVTSSSLPSAGMASPTMASTSACCGRPIRRRPCSTG